MEFVSCSVDYREVKGLWRKYSEGEIEEYETKSILERMKSCLQSREAVTKAMLNKPENRVRIRGALENLVSDKNVRLIPSKPTGFSEEKMLNFNLLGLIDMLLEHPSLDVERLGERDTEDYKINVDRHDKEIKDYITRLDNIEKERYKDRPGI